LCLMVKKVQYVSRFNGKGNSSVWIDLWVEGGRYVHATHKETNMGYFLNIWKQKYVRKWRSYIIWLHEY
jgi:hypothetical protein